MKLIYILLASWLLFFSCQPKPNIIPQKDMLNILLDINIAESYSNLVKDSLHKDGTKNIDSLTVYYKEIFAHHKITEAQFTQSLDWYKAHPETMDTLYEKIIAKVINFQSTGVK